ncbi:hypothetical protein OS493_030052 [Desmophyllum pertusum]|uniref:Peptidase S1 domain-containing protein n=1 Tax=Desmophyllum pertusum TaxID=174260 RepID=A0A9W9Z953_9CNID|nr:hypothetical protein OS493_030052 [Desmophyllum pertusum]
MEENTDLKMEKASRSQEKQDENEGAHNLKTLHGSTTIKVEKIIRHPHYKKKGWVNDVALIQLATAINPSQKVKIISLPNDPIQEGQEGNYDCHTTGWGRTRGKKGSQAIVLQEVKIPIVGHKDCQRKWAMVHENEMICAGGNNAGTCRGDSGGPLACIEGGKWILRGVTSWGHKKCRTDFFSVYARVSTYVDWIKSKTK